jgi:hypothetical protein
LKSLECHGSSYSHRDRLSTDPVGCLVYGHDPERLPRERGRTERYLLGDLLLCLERQVAATEATESAYAGLGTTGHALWYPVPMPGVLAEVARDAGGGAPDHEWLPGRKQQEPETTLWRHYRYHLHLGLRQPELLGAQLGLTPLLTELRLTELRLTELRLTELRLTELRLTELRLTELRLAELRLAELRVHLLERNRSRPDGERENRLRRPCQVAPEQWLAQGPGAGRSDLLPELTGEIAIGSLRADLLRAVAVARAGYRRFEHVHTPCVGSWIRTLVSLPRPSVRVR